MPTKDELRRLLETPNETLAIEYKSWLPIVDNVGKGTLAKAAIALANHGGGVIVLGMRGGQQDREILTSQPRPADLTRYTQDDINAAINRFADPAMHCELLFAFHPITHTEHAFVIVPGDLTTPVMSKRECPGVISAQRCYMRKPGPRSEEPFTGVEWRTLLDRCIRAGRDSMLDAIRHIVQGHAGSIPPDDLLAQLRAFESDSRVRWQRLTSSLPPDDPARMPHGFRELAFQIRNVPRSPSLHELRRRMNVAEEIRLTGWHPFLHLDREPFAPRVVDGAIETWLGLQEDNSFPRHSDQCDFWRASLDGCLYMIRGYDEDSLDGRAPGALFDVTLPIWRVAEPLLHVARLAREFGEDPEIVMICRHTGLANRVLTRIEGLIRVIRERRAADDHVEFTLTASVEEIENNLAELLYSALRPLYERFDFYELPRNIVTDELARLRRGRY
jgi:hypothetical protein